MRGFINRTTLSTVGLRVCICSLGVVYDHVFLDFLTLRLCEASDLPGLKIRLYTSGLDYAAAA